MQGHSPTGHLGPGCPGGLPRRGRHRCWPVGECSCMQYCRGRRLPRYHRQRCQCLHLRRDAWESGNRPSVSWSNWRGTSIGCKHGACPNPQRCWNCRQSVVSPLCRLLNSAHTDIVLTWAFTGSISGHASRTNSLRSSARQGASSSTRSPSSRSSVRISVSTATGERASGFDLGAGTGLPRRPAGPPDADQGSRAL